MRIDVVELNATFKPVSASLNDLSPVGVRFLFFQGRFLILRSIASVYVRRIATA